MTVTAPFLSPTGSLLLDSFRAVVQPSGGVALVGELDISGVEALRVALDQALLGAEDTVEIDATELTFIDSVAISELLRYQLMAAGQQRRFVVKASRQVAAVLDMLDLDPILVAPENP